MYIICVQHMVCNKSIKILFELFPRNSANQLYFCLLINVQENYKKKTLKSYIDAEILSPILPQILQKTKLWYIVLWQILIENIKIISIFTTVKLINLSKTCYQAALEFPDNYNYTSERFNYAFKLKASLYTI